MPNMTASIRPVIGPRRPVYWSIVYNKFLPTPSPPPVMNPTRSLVSQKSSDSGLHIQLHPLVLLTVSDQITRHLARQHTEPVLGGLLGQQNGREITLEHAFECPVTINEHNEIIMVASWFEERLQQLKDVHKSPALELVGWWAIAPPSGPTGAYLPLHQQILRDYNESAVFLGFHPQDQASASNGAKLPLGIFESVYEAETTPDAKDMQVDGEEGKLSIKFRELPYSVETGESEMIGIDTINRPNAHMQKKDKQRSETELSQADEELVANLTTRLNAVRTLESRISLIKSYLSSLAHAGLGLQDSEDDKHTKLSHPIVRDVNSLLSHLSILSPAEQSSFTTEVISQSNDVQLISLLGQLGESVKSMRELGRQTAIIQASSKAAKSRLEYRIGMQMGGEDRIPGSMPGPY
ncbi:uncharacterized protein N7506_002894 [Penicillium brevicompactum]|uniref:uncharacterized protein n=1 Tax=Penicillium brevicompactum TaxID=5074 RepID=UPI002540ED77|nr:uncharacterized protein N7506_002894 [Penicillium brevicompactum]KAJ5343070.1 hypothetical protein N7506_002894 [Penicillium brevicompactum]